MSDFNPEDYVAGPDGSLVEKTEQTSSKWRRDLERRAKKGDEALNQLAELQRKLALRDAGIPNTKLGDMFIRSYDGPMDDPEAIRAAWQEIAPAPPEDPRVAQALDGTQAALDLAAGAQTPPPNPDFVAQAKALKAKYRGATQFEEGLQQAKQLAHQTYGPQDLDRMQYLRG